MKVLGENEIQLYRFALDKMRSRLASLKKILSSDEREKAQRALVDGLCETRLIMFGLLRECLAGFLDRDPAEIEYGYGPHGKPFISPRQNPHCIEFNISHTENVLLIAVTKGQALGIDVERLDRCVDALELAERYFTKNEYKQLLALPEVKLNEGFFRCWTRKEAYIKATGLGLHCPLDSFEVSLSASGPGLLSVNGDGDAAAEWSIIEIDAGADLMASLAVKKQWPVVVTLIG